MPIQNEYQFYPSIFYAVGLIFFLLTILNKYAMFYGAIKYIYEITSIIDRKWDSFAIEIWQKKMQYIYLLFSWKSIFGTWETFHHAYTHINIKLPYISYLQYIQFSWVQYENCTTFNVQRTEVYLYLQSTLKTINFKYKTKFTNTIKAESEIWQQHSDNVRLC